MVLSTYRDHNGVCASTRGEMERPLHGEVKIFGLNHHVPVAGGHLRVHNVTVIYQQAFEWSRSCSQESPLRDLLGIVRLGLDRRARNIITVGVN